MSPDEEQTRDEIEEIVNVEPVQEPAQEAVVETILEEAKQVKTKAKAKAKAKPKTKITKEPVEPIKEYPLKEKHEPIIEVEKPEKIYIKTSRWLIAPTAI